jgi:phosphoglycerate kinase
MSELMHFSLFRGLAALADGYVNDAFGTSHRAHASVAGVPALLDDSLCGVGLLVDREITYLDFSGKKPDEKIGAIIGGSKVSTKLPVIKGLISQVDVLVLGGGLAFTFAKAQGIPIGDSLCEDTMVDTARDLIAEAKEKGKTMVLPIDAVCAPGFPSKPMSLEETKTFDMVPGAGIEDGWMGLDAGPKTVALFADALAPCSKIVFNGTYDESCEDSLARPTYFIVDYTDTFLRLRCITVYTHRSHGSVRDCSLRSSNQGAR